MILPLNFIVQNIEPNTNLTHAHADTHTYKVLTKYNLMTYEDTKEKKLYVTKLFNFILILNTLGSHFILNAYETKLNFW